VKLRAVSFPLVSLVNLNFVYFSPVDIEQAALRTYSLTL
jgi:hypothetical protein